MIDAQYRFTLTTAMNDAYVNVAQNRNVAIPTAVRTLLEDIAIESVVFRADEWLTRELIDCNDPIALPRTIPVTKESTLVVLNAAAIDFHGTHGYIGFSAVLQTIHQRWCGIFPFCR